LSPPSANCLLKTLEEPPPRAILILLGTSEQRQLPTVRSRCQTVRFRRLPDDFVRKQLLSLGLAADESKAVELAALAEGSLDRARQFADEGLTEFREACWTRLGTNQGSPQELAQWIGEFVDAAGREASHRRERLRYVIQLFVLLYRQSILIQSSVPLPPLDSLHQVLVKRHAVTGADVDLETRRLDRCLEALQQVDANANLRTLIECWIDDLSAALGLAAC
jgi:DNA polymerase-3 subunit delta'